MAQVAIRDLSKVYDDGTCAVDGLNLHIADGEFIVLVGPSGCGKTTALRMVAGLEEISGGEVQIGPRVVNDLAPRDRDIAMVFQSYALYPNMTVEDNTAFGLRMRKTPKEEIARRVDGIARTLGLQELMARKPLALSGGQRQRVAMGRAIVRRPAVFLMDEPLSNLDAKLRVQMRSEITRIQREVGTTTMYVTHDQVEAMTMGDRIAVMRKGRLQQVGPPQELYDRPSNLFVASFIGSPAMNLLRGRLELDGGEIRLCVGGQHLCLGADSGDLSARAGQDVAVGVRPELLRARRRPEDRSSLRGRVVAVESLGSDQLVHLDVGAPPVVTAEVIEIASDLDDALAQDLKAGGPERMADLVCRFDPRERIRPNDELDVRVEMGSLHLFDLDTGDALAQLPAPGAGR